jgi:O-antigen ligase
MTRSIRNAGVARRTLLWFGAITAALSMVIIFGAVTHWPLYSLAYDHLGVGQNLMLQKMRGGFARAEGPFGDATVAGFAMALGFLSLVVSRKEFRSFEFHIAILCLALAGLAATQARGAWLGAAVGFVAAIVYGRSETGSTLTRQAMIAAAAGGSTALAIASLGMAGRAADAADSASYRSVLLERGIEEFWRNPLFGIPHAQLELHLADLRQGEHIIDFVNSYLYYSLVGGIFGLILFALPFIRVPIGVWRVRGVKRISPDLRTYFCYCFAALAAQAVMLAFTSLAEVQTLLLIGTFGMAGIRFAPDRRPMLVRIEQRVVPQGSAGPKPRQVPVNSPT